MFRTLQDRLPKELRLAGIRHRGGQPLPRRGLSARANARFAVPAEQEGSAFVADAGQAWREILCIQEERQVGNDNTVKWKRLSLQIPSPLRPHFVRTKIRIHEYPDGQLAIFLGLHRLADHHACSRPIDAHARWPPEPLRPPAKAVDLDIASRSHNPTAATRTGRASR